MDDENMESYEGMSKPHEHMEFLIGFLVDTLVRYKDGQA